MSGLRHWEALKYSCPNCNAPVGSPCFTKHYYPVCKARHAQAPGGRLPRGFLEALPVSSIQGEGSKACIKHQCSKCRGRIKLGHGLGFKNCGCTCHKSTNTP